MLSAKGLKENLDLLVAMSKLNFKPNFLETVEQHVTKSNELNKAEPLARYLVSYQSRRKVSQTQMAMCIKVIDANFALLTQPETDLRKMFRQLLF